MTPDPRTSGWKVVGGSATGSSHLRNSDPCQDYAQFTFAGPSGSPSVVIACSDGAGSAARAQTGARLACREVLTAASSWIEEGRQTSAITPETAVGWYDRARRRLSLEACVEGLEVREYACTLLLAVAGERDAVFVQLGDGAIVFRGPEGYETAFWPQSGEYANTTNFRKRPVRGLMAGGPVSTGPTPPQATAWSSAGKTRESASPSLPLGGG